MPLLGYDVDPRGSKLVVNDEERFVFSFTPDGKIKKMDVISFGNVTGPAGFYEQVSGKPIHG